jgi:hypothetical protein
MSYRELDAQKILETLDRLGHRIEERFPGAGLGRVARDLRGLADAAVREAAALGAPNWPVRVAAFTLGGLMLFVIGYAAALAVRAVRVEDVGIADFFQGIEAAVNDLVFLGIGIWFLTTIEGRFKRRNALRHLHELRSVAHIVDMHQLTKDPDRLMSPERDTASSPSRTMTRAELGRYLDYCSELLSVTGKVAALFPQRFNDEVVLAAVNDVEELTTGLSRKIWQKIAILERRGDVA